MNLAFFALVAVGEHRGEQKAALNKRATAASLPLPRLTAGIHVMIQR